MPFEIKKRVITFFTPFEIKKKRVGIHIYLGTPKEQTRAARSQPQRVLLSNHHVILYINSFMSLRFLFHIPT